MSQWIEVKIFTTYNAADAIGEILYRNGANGLVYEDVTPVLDMQTTVSWDYSDIPVVDEPLENVYIVAYLPVSQKISPLIEDIKAEIELLSDYNLDVGEGKITYKIVNESDWQGQWKQYFKPLKVGNKIVVTPVWEDVTAEKDEIVIRIDPGLAFGTGSHATTQQALTLLEKYNIPGSVVMDVGSGSGILSITAGHLGAKKIIALDNDHQAVSMARSNIELNNIENCQIDVLENDLLNGITDSADIVLANITAPILKKLIPQATFLTNVGGIFICAGIIAEYELEVQKELLKANYIVIDRLSNNDWIGLAARKVK